MKHLSDIQMRDPFVLPVADEGAYYLFGTTDPSCWAGPFIGFDCYRSTDLEDWQGPVPAFRPPAGFWATRNFWAPEAYRYNTSYYIFATFKAEKRYRGTQVLIADRPEGPYRPLTDGPVTPADWECLDGTLYVDSAGTPWIVFCHEWQQIHNGAVYAMRLTPDLRRSAAPPVFLFNASEAAWVKAITDWPDEGQAHRFPSYVTDGPFLHRLASGTLLMLWSSIGPAGYAMGTARSVSGRIEGPWIQDRDPIWAADGGHGMVFRTFDDRLFVTLHSPNSTPDERPFFHEVREADDALVRI